MGPALDDPVRIIARRTLREFVESLEGHKDRGAVKMALERLVRRSLQARWANAAEIKQLYATASIVSAGRVVFNIKGNAYRLVVAVDFSKSIVWIKWIGTQILRPDRRDEGGAWRLS